MVADGNAAAAAAIAAPGTAPPALGIQAQLAPTTAAGFKLAKGTMWMIAVAIVVLVAMLLIAEAAERRVGEQTNGQLLSMVTASRSQSEDRRLPLVVAGLRRAASDPAWTMSTADAGDAGALIDQTLKNPAATDAQRASLANKCIPLPAAATPDRAAILQSCAATLEALTADPGSISQRVAFLQAMEKSLSDERAAHRAFWLQVAQLMLINLLLPILTALLGYIFGTQQGQK